MAENIKIVPASGQILFEDASGNITTLYVAGNTLIWQANVGGGPTASDFMEWNNSTRSFKLTGVDLNFKSTDGKIVTGKH